MKAWDVVNRNDDIIDTVWYTATMTAEEVRTSLIEHDFHDDDITVEVNNG